MLSINFYPKKRNSVHTQSNLDYMETVYNDGTEVLANAIVEQALRDYYKCLKQLKKTPKDYYLRKEHRQLLDFFYSDWFKMLCTANADYLLESIEKRV